MKKLFFLFILAILSIGLISPSVATSVVYENNSLVVSGVPDDGIGLGAFDIVLLYPEIVQVSGVTLTPPFLGVVNDQQEGRVILAGFQVSEVLTGDVPVASLTVAGDPASLDIRVRSLLNQRSDEISMTNADYSEPVSPSNGGSGGSGDSSGVQTPVTSEVVAQSTKAASSGTSPEKGSGGDETGAAMDSSLSTVVPSGNNIAVTTEIPVLEVSNPAKETSSQKSSLSGLGIFILISVVVLISRKYNRIRK
jgi:hypothetical protein